MSKNLIIPKSFSELTKLIDIVDGFIIGIKDLSVNLPTFFSINEVEKIVNLCNDKKREIFISINKNMHNSDIDLLKNTLINLSKLNIGGIMFYDISVLNINKELNLNLNLIWNQEHLVTNYNTINFYRLLGVDGAYLSSELSLEEIKKIRNNTNCSLFINVFGYIPMFTSKRPLVNNYLKTFDLKDISKINYLQKENNLYPIVSEGTTTIYSSKICSYILEMPYFKDNFEYLIFNSFNIKDSDFEKVIEIYNNLKNNCKENFNKLNLLLNYNCDTGFLYKETVYKVKKNG